MVRALSKPTQPTPSVLADLRRRYHEALQTVVWGWDKGEASNADKPSKLSGRIAREMLAGAREPTNNPVRNQTAGKVFTEETKRFVEQAFNLLGHMRPGNWRYSTAQGLSGITIFDQYQHLATIKRLLDEHRDDKGFRAAFAVDYLVLPDIVIGREPLQDEEINRNQHFLDKGEDIARGTPLRAGNDGSAIMLHASISCKWTIRSDRAQNTRTEALNLIRNRKGNSPHIVAVTAEPLPTRLASLALGAGDLDCVYHMALYELGDALNRVADESQLDMFDTLVQGRRLRDISDLPLDLSI